MKRIISILMLAIVSILVACTPTLDETVPVSSIVVASETVYLNVGSNLTLDVTVLPVDATDKTLEWSVENTSIATVEQSGKLAGVAIGSTTLTIKSNSTPSVLKTVSIEVVDQLWPLHQIRDFTGFDLPAFPDFTNVVVIVSETTLTLKIKGTVDNEISLAAYKDTLLALGWEVDGSFDNHAGKLVHNSYQYYITMHNEFVHHGDTIEFKIIKSNTPHDETDWDEVNEEVEEHFGFTLPEFPQYESISIVHGSNHVLKVVLSGITDVDGSLEAYLTLLEAQGWIAGEGNNHHIGTYTKEGLDVILTYHESHDNNHTLELIISEDEHHHHDETDWDEVNEEVEEHFGFTLPEFPQYESISIVHGSNHVLKVVLSGITDVDGSLEAYLMLLEAQGWIAGEGNNHHIGTYTKEGLDVILTYHESHDNNHTLELIISEHEHNHEEDEVLEWPSDEIDEHTGLTIPAYPQFTSIRIHHESPFTLEVLGIEDYNISLFEYEDILNDAGWFADGDGLNDHIGYFFKDGENYYIVLHNGLVHGGDALEIIFVLIASEGELTS